MFDRVFAELERAVACRPTLVEQYAALLEATDRMNRDDPTAPAFVVGVAGDAQRHPELTEADPPAAAAQQPVLPAARAAPPRHGGELDPTVDVRAVEDLLNAVVSGLARLSAITGDARRHAAAVDVLQRFFAGTLIVSPLAGADQPPTWSAGAVGAVSASSSPAAAAGSGGSETSCMRLRPTIVTVNV